MLQVILYKRVVWLVSTKWENDMMTLLVCHVFQTLWMLFNALYIMF